MSRRDPELPAWIDWHRANCAGVYQIQCLKSGATYIGSSVNIAGRWKGHIRDLTNGDHHSRYMQNAWRKHGPRAFRFSVVVACPPEEVRAVEQRLLDVNFRQGRNMCFNVRRKADGGVDPDPEIQAKLAAITPMEWAWMSNVAIGKRLGVHVATIAWNRPEHIPTPGASSAYLSAATKAGKAGSEREQEIRKERAEARPMREAARRAKAAAEQERRIERIRAQDPSRCAQRDCGAEACLLQRPDGRPWYCSSTCKWREQARRQAARRATYKRKRRAEARAIRNAAMPGRDFLKSKRAVVEASKVRADTVRKLVDLLLKEHAIVLGPDGGYRIVEPVEERAEHAA